jgi:maleate isomerase
VTAELRRPDPARKATTLLSGVIEGLRALAARRIVVGTPYLDEINRLEQGYLEARGFEVLDIQGLNLTYDTEMNAVTPAYLADFARAIDRPEADAVFISCGALRTIEVIDEIEAALGKPVVASNQAMLWHCLRLAGIDDRIEGYGRLFRDH